MADSPVVPSAREAELPGTFMRGRCGSLVRDLSDKPGPQNTGERMNWVSFTKHTVTKASGVFTAFILAAGLTPAIAQTTPAENSAPAPGATGQASPPPSAATLRAPYVVAKFTSFLNTKSLKTGDPVTAKTIVDLKLKDLDIPKGSKLVGSITQAQSMKDGNGTASLAIRFDHIELKGGAVMRFAGLIVAIAEVTNDPGLGTGSVLSRGGVGSTVGTDPNMDIGNTGKKDAIGLGSSIPGIALGIHLDQNQATQLRGMKKDIKIDTDTEIKVALFREP
jgi:hypothetical protein